MTNHDKKHLPLIEDVHYMSVDYLMRWALEVKVQSDRAVWVRLSLALCLLGKNYKICKIRMK